MKPIHLLFIFLFLSPCLYAQQHSENEEGQFSEENEEGSLLRELTKSRLQKLYLSAGTKNLSLLNYRALNQQKQLEKKELAGPQGINGYTPFNGNWSQINTAQSSWGMGRINCFAADPVNANTLYAGTPTGGLWKTTDNGGTWNCLTSALAVPGISGICISPNNTNVIYILTGSASSVECQSLGVFKTTDGGLNWLPTALDSSYVSNWFYTAPQFNANKLIMDPTNSNILLAAMTTGLYRTDNGGLSWTQAIKNIEVRDVAFQPGNTNIVYVTTANITARASNDGGQTFGLDWYISRPSYVPNYSSLTLAVTPAAPDSVFFVGTSDNGTLDSDSVYVIRSGYFAAGRNFNFSRYNKCSISGSDYAISALRWYRDARLAISPVTTAEMYVNGLWTYATSNYGITWRNKHLNGGGNVTIHSDGSQISYVNGYVYASNDGGIYRQLPSPATATDAWTILTGTMPISQIYRIGASQVNTVNFVTALQDNGCHSISALTYSLLNSGDGLMARMSPTTPGTYYYRVNNYRTIRRKAGADVDITPIAGTGYGFLPFEVDQADETRLYTAYQNLHISTNEGTAGSWVTKTTGATRDNRCMAVSRTNNNVFWLLETEVLDANGSGNVVTPAVLRRTINGGISFSVITLPVSIPVSLISAIVISRYDENRVYLTIDGYNTDAKVFVTVNGSNATPANITWTNLASNTLPNVPVTCLAYESSADNSIYIGTEIGMYYYNSVMNRWISFNNGMPVCRVTDLYINYSSLKIIAATYGRGIFISDFYSTCNTTLNLSGSQSGSLTYSAGTTLNSTAELSGGEASRIKYYAGTDLFLNPGFNIGPGTNFIAAIGPCGGKIDPFLYTAIRDTTLLTLKNGVLNENVGDKAAKRKPEYESVKPSPTLLKQTRKPEIKQ